MTLENYSTSDVGQPLVDKMNLHKTATDGKAPTNHTHGEGTAVCGAGNTAARPASGNWIYHNTQRGVIERIVSGVKVDDIVPHPGFISGLAYSYKDADELTIGSGILDIGGIPRTLSASLDDTYPGLGTNAWYHLIAIIGSDTDIALDADSFLLSNNATPVWSDTYKYWGFTYGASEPANSRAIGAVRTNGSAEIIAFKLYGDKFRFNDPLQLLNTSTDPGSLTALGADVPFDTEVDLYGQINVTAGKQGWIMISQDGSNNIVLAGSDYSAAAASHYGYGNAKCMTNGSKQIYYRTQVNTGTFTGLIELNGFKLPRGYAHG